MLENLRYAPVLVEGEAIMVERSFYHSDILYSLQLYYTLYQLSGGAIM
jgi:hypothetical protein